MTLNRLAGRCLADQITDVVSETTATPLHRACHPQVTPIITSVMPATRATRCTIHSTQLATLSPEISSHALHRLGQAQWHFLLPQLQRRVPVTRQQSRRLDHFRFDHLARPRRPAPTRSGPSHEAQQTAPPPRTAGPFRPCTLLRMTASTMLVVTPRQPHRAPRDRCYRPGGRGRILGPKASSLSHRWLAGEITDMSQTGTL